MIDPRGMTLTQWSDAVLLVSSYAWSPGRLDDEARWQEWAVNLLRTPTFSTQAAPDPYGFTDWRDWAMRVYPMLEAA